MALICSIGDWSASIKLFLIYCFLFRLNFHVKVLDVATLLGPSKLKKSKLYLSTPDEK
jgi:hypothetical protein